MKLRIFLSSFACILFLISCGGSSNNNTNECDSDFDCLSSKKGSSCFLGTCRSSSSPSCFSDRDCSSGAICSEGQCMTKEAACLFKKCPNGQTCLDGKCQEKPKPIEIQEFCNTQASNQCKHIYKCFSQDRIKEIETELGFNNQDSCSRQFAVACEKIFIDGVKANRQVYYPERASQCLSSFENHACSEPNSRPAICSQVTEGRRNWKQTCEFNVDCSAKNAKCLGRECTGDIIPSSFQKECSELTIKECKTLNCLELKPNLQNKAGICTLQCKSNADCGSGSSCYKLSEDDNACFSNCKSDSDCTNGFVCIDVGNNSGDKICLVRTK